VKKAEMPSITTYTEMRKMKTSPLHKLMFFKKTNIFGRALLGLLLLVMFTGVASSEEKRIVIVKSSESPFFQAAAEGVKKEIRKGNVDPVFIEYNLSLESPHKNQINRIRELNPDLIVTIGSKSTAFLSEHIRDVPIVFSAVLNPISSGFARSMRSAGGNLTGASLDIPIRTQLEKFKLIVPGLQKVGVICTYDSEPVVQEAKRVCREIGLEAEGGWLVGCGRYRRLHSPVHSIPAALYSAPGHSVPGTVHLLRQGGGAFHLGLER
jgi:ABC-type uncharacterized transport system substrate-binding protein